MSTKNPLNDGCFHGSKRNQVKVFVISLNIPNLNLNDFSITILKKIKINVDIFHTLVFKENPM